MSAVRQFGGFDLHEKIGTGGMATVYRGTQRSLDRAVVLKILHPHLSDDEHLLIRFEREARAAANLRHENIVQVIDCGREESTSYIAMEFVDGMDLKRLMDAHGPPPIEMAVLILRDICRGLEHAHQRHIIHRDVKPANVMLTPEGTVKIMDFGLARQGEDSVGMTATGAVLGTPAYMSPEQATGLRVDERSDVFSVGVMGYEMLGGRRPFPGDSYTSVLNAILSLDPEPLDQVNPQVPPEIVSLIHRMLEKDVTRRAPSITAVKEELETIAERMGLVRGKDLLRRYAVAPAEVAAALNEARGPGPATSLAVSSAVMALLTRTDLRSQDTVVLDPASRNAESSRSPSGETRPSGNDRSSSSRSSASTPSGPVARSVAPVDVTVAESIADAPSSGARRSAAAVPYETGPVRVGPSRNMILAIGGGVFLFAALAFAIFRFAGSGLDPADSTAGDAEFVETPPTPPVEQIDPPDVTPGFGEDDNPEEEETDGLAEARPEGRIPIPGAPGVPGTGFKPGLSEAQVKEIERMAARAESIATAGRLKSMKIQSEQVERRTREATGTGRAKQYLVNPKPYALVYVDGRRTPVNQSGMPATLSLAPGTHTFRAVNADLVPPVDIEFTYVVRADDPNNSLILNLKTGAVESRKNTTLPF
jgi:serine/threonine protein kinase